MVYLSGIIIIKGVFLCQNHIQKNLEDQLFLTLPQLQKEVVSPELLKDIFKYIGFSELGKVLTCWHC